MLSSSKNDEFIRVTFEKAYTNITCKPFQILNYRATDSSNINIVNWQLKNLYLAGGFFTKSSCEKKYILLNPIQSGGKLHGSIDIQFEPTQLIDTVSLKVLSSFENHQLCYSVSIYNNDSSLAVESLQVKKRNNEKWLDVNLPIPKKGYDNLKIVFELSPKKSKEKIAVDCIEFKTSNDKTIEFDR